MSMLREFGRWLIYYPFRRIIVALPRRTLTQAAKTCGILYHFLNRRRSKIASDEIKLIFGNTISEKAAQAYCRQGFILFSQIFMETFCFGNINPSNVEAWIRLEGRDRLEKALSLGRGAIIILIHFGANQLAMAALGHRGYRVNQLGSAPDDWNRLSGIEPTPLQKKIFELKLCLEKRLPANFIYIARSMRPVYDCLKRNEIMLFAADGRAGHRFEKAQVGRRVMNVSSGPFRIAWSTGASLLPAFCVHEADGVHAMQIEDPIEPCGSDESSWVADAIKDFGARISDRILDHPDHYCMLMSEAKLRSQIDATPLFDDYSIHGENH